MNNAYHLVSRWRVGATRGEVADILGDPPFLPQWWPSVFLAVTELTPAAANGLGRRVALVTKGWLPRTLRWEFEVVESHYPSGFSIVATGDLDGLGVWTFLQDGAEVDITYDWRVRADKPLLRAFSFVTRPLFESNHRWAMAQGQVSLELELARRRATSQAARARLAPPPGPVTYAGVGLVAGAAAIGATLTYLLIRARRDSTRRREQPRPAAIFRAGT